MARPGALPLYFLVLAWTVAAAGLLALLLALSPLLYPPALLAFIFPLAGPVAVCRGLNRPGLAWGLVGAAAMAVLAGFAAGAVLVLADRGGEAALDVLRRLPIDGSAVVLASVSGLWLGRAIARQWHFGYAVVLLASVVTLLGAAEVALHWNEWAGEAQSFYRQLGTTSGDTPAGPMLMAWRKNWQYTDAGLYATVAMLSATLLISLVTIGMRRFADVPGLRGRFREMRTPDALVWVGIGLAVVWFVNTRWVLPEPVKLAASNGALGLAGVYFLNGLAVLGYALALLKPRLWIVAVAVLLLVYLGLFPMVAMLGLFDTWAEFRVKLDQLVARIREQRSEDDDPRGP